MQHKKFILFQSTSWVGANTCLTILSQILIPISFIHIGGTVFYAKWILVNGFASFILISDLGIGSVLSQEIMRLKENNNLINTNYFFEFVSKIFFKWIILITFLFLVIGGMADFLIMSGSQKMQYFLLFSVLAIANSFYAYYSIALADYRIRNQFAKFQRCLAIEKFLEVLFLIIAIESVKSLFIGGVCILLSRIILSLYFKNKLRVNTENFANNLGDKKIALRPLKDPLFANLCVIGGNWFRMQGTQIIAGGVLGLAGAGVFNLVRTYASGVRQISDGLYVGFIPLISQELISKKFKSSAQTIKWLIFMTFSLGLLYLLLSYFFGVQVISLWVHRDLGISRQLVLSLVALSVLDNFILLPLAIFSSINRQLFQAVSYLSLSFLSLVSAYSLGIFRGETGLIAGLYFFNIIGIPVSFLGLKRFFLKIR
jgi:O-antigen/teichoic acid export membrane protein